MIPRDICTLSTSLLAARAGRCQEPARPLGEPLPPASQLYTAEADEDRPSLQNESPPCMFSHAYIITTAVRNVNWLQSSDTELGSYLFSIFLYSVVANFKTVPSRKMSIEYALPYN
jgi:hypothetical protein